MTSFMPFRQNIATDWSVWIGGGLAALAAHAAVAYALTSRALPPPATAVAAGGFVVELAEIATSRAETAPDYALGEDQLAQRAIAPSVASEALTPPRAPEPVADDLERPIAEPERPSHQPQMPSQRAQPEITESRTTHMLAAVRDATDRAREQAARTTRHDAQAVAAWMQTLQLALQKNKQYPEDAREQRAEGQVILRVTLDRDGSLQNVTVLKSSGFQALDEAASELAAKAAPFPPPPQVGKDGLLKIRIPVGYVLK